MRLARTFNYGKRHRHWKPRPMLAPLIEQKWSGVLHAGCHSRNRECFGWMCGSDGAIVVCEAQHNGQITEVRVIRNGYIAAFLRGKHAREWDAEN